MFYRVLFSLSFPPSRLLTERFHGSGLKMNSNASRSLAFRKAYKPCRGVITLHRDSTKNTLAVYPPLSRPCHLSRVLMKFLNTELPPRARRGLETYRGNSVARVSVKSVSSSIVQTYFLLPAVNFSIYFIRASFKIT